MSALVDSMLGIGQAGYTGVVPGGTATTDPAPAGSTSTGGLMSLVDFGLRRWIDVETYKAVGVPDPRMLGTPGAGGATGGNGGTVVTTKAGISPVMLVGGVVLLVLLLRH